MFARTLAAAAAAALLALTPATAEVTIDDFSKDRGWRAVNDGVMGGKSRGGPRIADGVLTFAGTISLENNGGFSSTRCESRRDLSGFDGIELRVKGDGRRYYASLRTDATRWGMRIAYWAPLQTTKDRWTVVRIPFAQFVPTSFGRKLSGPKLDPARVRSVGLMMYDKQRGPFRIDVDFIRAYKAGDRPAEVTSQAPRGGKDLVDVATSAGFSTLLRAAKAAGLVDVLRSKTLTVLAPTNAAFARIPPAQLKALLSDKAQLRAVLTLHVIAGKQRATDLAARARVTSLAGPQLQVAARGGALRVGEASVMTADVPASNGVIHVIDRVLMPPPAIPAIAAKAGTFGTLLAAAKAAGLVDALSGDEPLTVFAPTDAAFAKLPKGTLEKLTSPEGKPLLKRILLHHVVAGRVRLSDGLRAGEARTLAGTELRVGLVDGALRVAEGRIQAADIEAGNGVIHVIDRVLIPPTAAPETPAAAAVAVIERAIELGAPLYNAGQPAACRAIYEVAAAGLLGSAALSDADRKVLRAALEQSRRQAADEAAWTLRRALDATYAALSQTH